MNFVDSLWEVNDLLWGMRQPKEAEFELLNEQGIEAVVSLMSDSNNANLYLEHQLDYLWLPIEGGQLPSIYQVKTFVHFVALKIKQHKKIAVHCQGGRGRTGLLMCCYLIYKGLDLQSALDHLKQVKAEAVPTKSAQLEFLQEWQNIYQ